MRSNVPYMALCLMIGVHGVRSSNVLVIYAMRTKLYAGIMRKKVLTVESEKFLNLALQYLT